MANPLEKLKGFRTVIVNVAAAAGVIATALSGVDLNGDTTALIVTAVAAINVILRYFTTTPIFKGDKQDAA